MDDGLGFLEVGDCERAAEPADPALSETALGEAVVDRRPGVRPDRAELDFATDAQRAETQAPFSDGSRPMQNQSDLSNTFAAQLGQEIPRQSPIQMQPPLRRAYPAQDILGRHSQSGISRECRRDAG